MISRVARRCTTCGGPLAGTADCPSCLLGLGIETPAEATSHPEHIGPYRVLDTLGQGGMGIVYLAEQDRPIRRRVALKVIKPGMDSGQVLQRFESERQALALMAHPNVAKVFDAGVSEDGRPYFVLELVSGEPITHHCDRERLSVRARLGLFLQTCDALQHAHQKGIIHRDVKPTNLLVCLEGDQPTVKVIDFGVAKALHQKLTERTLETQLGVVLGTPEYMSPEQAGAATPDVDTRADLYSLGVVLYELLVGALPFDPKELRASSDAEVLRIIREVDAPRPVVRLKALGSAASEVARRRGTDLPTLARVVSGELEWIVLKALEKAPARRYASASELAADLRRFLADEPVLARPQTTWYRVRKLVRRNRGAVIAAGAVVLALAAGLVVSTVLYFRAVAARDEARRETAKAQAINDFLQETMGSAETGKQGRKALVVDVLERAAAQVDTSFANQPDVRAALHRTIGGVFDHLGLMGEAEREALAVLEYHRVTFGERSREWIDTRTWLGILHMEARRYDDAIDDFGVALEHARDLLGLEDSTTADAMHLLGNVQGLVGRFAEAEPLLLEGLRIHERVDGPEHFLTARNRMSLGTMYSFSYRLDQAVENFRHALETYGKTVGPIHWMTLRCRQELAEAYVREGRLDLAEPLARGALEVCRSELGELHSQTALATGTVAQLDVERGDFEEAERILRDLIARHRAVDTADRILPTLLRRLTHVLAREGKDEAVEIGRQTVAETVREYGENSFVGPAALRALGFALYRARHSDFSEAEASFRRALSEYRERFGELHPYVAGTLQDLGRMEHARGRHAAAVEAFSEALRMVHDLSLDAPWLVAELESDLGGCLVECGRFAEADAPLTAGYEFLRSHRGDADRLTVEALERRIALLEATRRSSEADALRPRLPAPSRPTRPA